MGAIAWRVWGLAGAAAVALAACHDATAPIDPALRSLEGVFVLRTVDSQPVPVLQLDYTYTRQYLDADTMTFDGRGHFSRVTVTRIDSVGRAYSERDRVTGTGTYLVQGDSIRFPFHCPPGAMCVMPPVGWRLPDGSLVIGSPRTRGFMFVSRYERVR